MGEKSVARGSPQKVISHLEEHVALNAPYADMLLENAITDRRTKWHNN